MSRWPFYATLAAPAVVINTFVSLGAPAASLWRPLVVSIAVTLLVQVGVTIVTRNARIGAFVAFLAVTALVGIEALLLTVVAINVPVVVGLIQTRRPGTVPWTTVTRALNVLAPIFLALSVWNGVTSGAFVAPPAIPAPIAASADRPDIFVILLDAYPRADTLAADFGIDNSPWLDEMAAHGFDVAERSRSNYNMTQLTLPSMLAYQHILELDVDAEAAPSAQWRGLSNALNTARGLDDLHRAGYEIVTITSPAQATSLLSADVVIEGQEPTNLEVSLLHGTALRHVVPDLQRDWFAGAYRAALTSDIASLKGLAEPTSRPRFVLAHIFAPHPPFVFGADGEPAPIAPCFPATCQLWDSGYYSFDPDTMRASLAGFLAWANAQVSEATAEIQERATTPPVVIVFSDHGLRHELEDRSETTTSLFLSSTPGHPGLFPDDTTPINILPRVLNAYAGASLPMATEETYWTDMTTLGTLGPLELERVPR